MECHYQSEFIVCPFLILSVHFRMEPSTRQVRNPINKKSAEKWKSKLSKVMQEEIWNHCPMLRRLGYKRD